MDKIAFLEILQKKLSCLPQSDIDKTVDYYSEMIDDRMEDGTSEEEAVCAAAGVFACAVLAADGNAGNAVFILGAALMCAGISLLLLPCFNRISKGLFGLSRRALLFVKSRFAGRERA